MGFLIQARAVEDLTFSFTNSCFQVVQAGYSFREDCSALISLFVGEAHGEVHIQIIPGQSSDFGCACSSCEVVVVFALETSSDCNLLDTSLFVGKTESMLEVGVVLASDTLSFRVGFTKWILDLAYSHGVEEVDTIAVETVSVFGEF